MPLKRHAPGWVSFGAFTLAATAGWLNVIGYLGLAHQSMSHVTGTLTVSAMELARGGFSGASRALLVVLCFFAGAALAGVLIRDSALHLGRRYGVALLVECALLSVALVLFLSGSLSGEYLAVCACGLQNGLATSYSGAVIRTTHMTGVVTDLGLVVGQALARRPVDWLRFRVHLALLSGFASGGLGGALAFGPFRYGALLVPIAVTGGAGAAYTLWRRQHAHGGHA